MCVCVSVCPRWNGKGGFANSKVSFIRANVSVKFPDVTDTIARIKDTGSGTILQGALYVKIKDPF